MVVHCFFCRAHALPPSKSRRQRDVDHSCEFEAWFRVRPTSIGVRPLTPSRNDTYGGKRRLSVSIPLLARMLALARRESSRQQYLQKRGSLRALASKRGGSPVDARLHCEGAARKHRYHRSRGLFTPSPPRLRTWV